MRNKMKLEAKRNGRRHSSMCVINVNGCINRLLNFKNKKGGYKILKRPLIYYSGMFSCLLVLAMLTFITAGCDKPNAVPTTNEQTLDTDVVTSHDLMGNEEENDTVTTNYALAGTKWKLEGFVT
ncbi:MAG: hypothetical protein LBL13_05965, partial [Bacteroidales bacterium]|nr:hypothetical protein [Bacteroidales bacterium]